MGGITAVQPGRVLVERSLNRGQLDGELFIKFDIQQLFDSFKRDFGDRNWDSLNSPRGPRDSHECFERRTQVLTRSSERSGREIERLDGQRFQRRPQCAPQLPKLKLPNSIVKVTECVETEVR